MVRIGICSFAHGHAYSYAGNLVRQSGATLVGITDEEPSRGRDAATKYGAPFFETLDDLLKEGLDGLIICSDNSKHREYVEAAARARVHILCEKPIATTIADGEAMIKACSENGVRLHIAFPCRFHSAAKRIKTMLDQGRIGKVLAVKGTNHGSMPGGWFTEKELSGGGAVIDHTVHVVDLIRWMMGAEVTSVYAEMDTLIHKELKVEDVGLLTMELSNGAFATLDTSWSRLGSYPTWGDVTMEIIGTDGTLSLDMFAQNITLYSEADKKAQWLNWGDDMDLGLVADFIDSFDKGGKPFISGEDGLRALEVALKAYESAKAGRPV